MKTLDTLSVGDFVYLVQLDGGVVDAAEAARSRRHQRAVCGDYRGRTTATQR